MSFQIKRKIAQSVGLLAISMGITLTAWAAPVTFGTTTATYCQSSGGSWPISAAIDGSFGSLNGWAIHPQEGSNQTAVFQTTTDIGNGSLTEITINLHHLYNTSHSFGKFRLAATTSSRSLYGQGAECSDANPGGTAAWIVLDPQSVVSANGETLTVQPDNSILASGTLPDNDVVTFRVATQLQGITGFRLEALADNSLPFNGPGRYPGNGNFVLTEFTVDAQNVALVPALDAWGLAWMSLLLGSAGMFWLRRQRN